MEKAKNHLETAKHHMVTRVATALETETVDDVLKRFYRKKPIYDNLDYIHVLNKKGVIKGIISVREIINADKRLLVTKIMSKKFATVRQSTDQEQVAMKAIKYGVKAVPVVDKEGVLLGVVPPKVIFKILQWEHTEDLLRLSGHAGKGSKLRNAIQAGVVKMSLLRLPSLLIGLIGGLLATLVVQYYEVSLQSQLVLAFFIPIMLYLSAAVGAQTGTILVRNLATEEVKIGSYMLREMAIGLLMASILGSIMFAVVYFWHQSFPVALTVGVSLLITITLATVMGIVVPLGLAKLNKDPAISGGPIINVLGDILTLLIYFSVATAILL